MRIRERGDEMLEQGLVHCFNKKKAYGVVRGFLGSGNLLRDRGCKKKKITMCLISVVPEDVPSLVVGEA